MGPASTADSEVVDSVGEGADEVDEGSWRFEMFNRMLVQCNRENSIQAPAVPSMAPLC